MTDESRAIRVYLEGGPRDGQVVETFEGAREIQSPVHRVDPDHFAGVADGRIFTAMSPGGYPETWERHPDGTAGRVRPFGAATYRPTGRVNAAGLAVWAC